MCNKTWEVKQQQEACGASFSSMSIAQLRQRSPVIEEGLKVLWYTSQNMLKHQPKPFHLYAISGDQYFSSTFDHSSMYVLAYAEQAARVGMDYTVYFSSYPGMKQSLLGNATLMEKLWYRSSVGWRNLTPQIAQTTPNSLDEHVLFACHVLGVACKSAGPTVFPHLFRVQQGYAFHGIAFFQSTALQ